MVKTIKFLEVQASSSLPIDLLLWIPPRENKAILKLSLSHSLGLWDRMCKIYSLKSPYTPVAAIFGNPQDNISLHGGLIKAYTV